MAGMSFFLRNKQAANKKDKKKRKASQAASRDVPEKKRSKKLDDEVSSDSEDEAAIKRHFPEHESDVEETAQERKLRLAKKYLEEIEKQEREKHDEDEIDKSVLSNRLRDDVLEQAGRLVKKVADTFDGADESAFRFLRNGHKLSVTCLVVAPNGKFVYTGSKDSCLIKWDLESGKKLKVIPGGKKGTEETHVGHTTHILSLAISSDGKFIAAGDESKLIQIWNPDTMERIHIFKGHRGAVTGVAFRNASHTLYSCSHDRSVKVWNLDEKAYIETLFGHQECIQAIDSLTRERALTAGGRDTSIRIWKIIEESQLVFQGSGQSIDCVKFLDEQHFVSGGDDGSISLWGLQKKKPLNSIHKAHGDNISQVPNWITAIATLVNSDLFATGSQDGQIRVWKASADYKKVLPLFNIPIKGFINSLQFSPNGDYLVAGVGQEHRLGRWWRIKEAKNQVVIIPLKRINAK